MNLEKIEIIVSEIDGIITDGMKPVDHMNYTMYKNYCERDFDAINELKKYFTFVFLADDADVSYNMMRPRNIPAFFTSSYRETKLQLLQRILSRYNTTPENLLYIGNKLSDIPCMNYAEVALTIPESSVSVERAANSVLDVPSGKGIICKLYDILCTEIEKRQRK